MAYAGFWFILSLVYFSACIGLFSCSVWGLCRTPASSALIISLRRWRFVWFLSVALLVVLFGAMRVAMLAEKGPSVGWRELLRHGGDEFFVYLACGVLLPFTLAIKRWQHRFLVVLVVATVSFFVYGRAFLLLGAGA